MIRACDGLQPMFVYDVEFNLFIQFPGHSLQMNGFTCAQNGSTEIRTNLITVINPIPLLVGINERFRRLFWINVNSDERPRSLYAWTIKSGINDTELCFSRI